jgi:hypothetical protein
VSCVSPTACTAVGTFGNQPGYDHYALAERWDGVSWAIQSAPSVSEPGETYSILEDVSCTSTAFCIAVGYHYTGAGTYPLAERWDGSTWSIQTVPPPSGTASSYLHAVSCVSSSACTAVGGNPARGATALVERWDGTTWSIQPTPLPGDAVDAPELDAVSCASSAACSAVGHYGSASGTNALAEHWNGSSWSTQVAYNPPAPQGLLNNNYLLGVSCPTTTSCIAAGQGPDGALLERWHDGAWVAEPAPIVGVGLSGVSCVSETACMAVGIVENEATHHMDALAERWDGTNWSVQSLPTVTGAWDTELEGVSCTVNGPCVAAGWYFETGASQNPLIERYR